MQEILETLLAAGPVVTDGAWGTQLHARGLPQGQSPDHWNLTNPQQVEQVPRAYVEAGSQVVITNTFQASRLALENHGLADLTAEINRAGVEISRRAVGDRARVFASMGPSGRMLLAGQVTEEELSCCFVEQATALGDARPDAIVIETMADLAEAKLALAAAKGTGLPVVACMVFDSGKELDRTMMGATPEQVAEELTAAGADVVGANCGQGPATYVSICRRLQTATDRPIWIKPNAGLPHMDGDRIVYSTTPAEFADYAGQLVDAGARFVGGCCGTTPAFIEAVRKQIDS